MTQLPLQIDSLRDVADSFLHDVDAALEEHPELAEQLKEMLEAEQDEDDEDDDDASRFARSRAGADLTRTGRRPMRRRACRPAKSLVDAVEKYLRQARGDEPPPPPAPAPPSKLGASHALDCPCLERCRRGAGRVSVCRATAHARLANESHRRPRLWPNPLLLRPAPPHHGARCQADGARATPVPTAAPATKPTSARRRRSS